MSRSLTSYRIELRSSHYDRRVVRLGGLSRRSFQPLDCDHGSFRDTRGFRVCQGPDQLVPPSSWVEEAWSSRRITRLCRGS